MLASPRYRKAHPLERVGSESGIRESNPFHSLGKAGHGRYTNPAIHQDGTDLTSGIQQSTDGFSLSSQSMNDNEVKRLLEEVRAGKLDVEQASARLRPTPVADLGYANVDLQRRDRCGFPEVVYAEGKTYEWLEGVVRQLSAAGQDCLATRLSAEQADHMKSRYPAAEQDRLARTFWLPHSPPAPPAGRVAVLTAGTSDLPVAKRQS